LEPPEKPPGENEPLGPPFGGAPSPKLEADTPCFFRQLLNFLIDAVLDFFVEVLEDAEATPPLAVTTTPERARASRTPGDAWNLEDRFDEVVVFVIATVWRANLEDR
jgi:hypothetical protein